MDSARRLAGLDLARFVALAGTVLVHASSDLVLPPLEAAAGGAELLAPPAAGWLELVQAVATNRARLLFLLLAGVGVALLVRRRGPSTAVLARRALFLLALGVGLVLLGWSDLVLVFYAVLFLLAPLLLRLPVRGLLLTAAEPGLFRTAFTVADELPDSHDLVSGRGPSPFQLLSASLDALVEVGLLPAARRPFAEMTAWSAVHGLSMLLIDGPLKHLDSQQADQIGAQVLDHIDAALLG